MPKKKSKNTCTVEFVSSSQHGPTAVLFDRQGNSLNVMNFPRGHRLTPKEKARARRHLMTGCAELSRRWKREV